MLRATLQPAPVEIEEALVHALIVEELEDGSFTAVVRSMQAPTAGSFYIPPPECVDPVAISFTRAIGVFSKWGPGTCEFVRAMKAAPVAQPAAWPRGAPSQQPSEAGLAASGIGGTRADKVQRLWSGWNPRHPVGTSTFLQGRALVLTIRR